MKLGLFGGTFDPIHVGHLDVIRASREALQLDEVWVIPSRIPPHRRHPLASPEHRFAMVSLAVEDLQGVKPSDLEMTTAGVSYTTETLDRVASLGVPGDSTFFILGGDAFLDIPAWKGYPAILDRCHFVAVSRPDFAVTALPTLLPELASRIVRESTIVPARMSIFLVDAATSAVSSTQVRQAILDRKPLDGLVPRAAADYIVNHGLYAATPANSYSQGRA
jgi:nicotinate-nucleotide adenylyltransferase